MTEFTLPAGGSSNQLQNNNAGVLSGTNGITFSDPASLTPSKLLVVGDIATSGQYLPIEAHASFAVAADFYTHADAEFRAPYVNFYKSRGTQATPTAVLHTGYELDSIGGINFGGYDGSTYFAGAASILTQTDENWAPGHHGAHLTIYGTNPGSSPRQIAQFGGLDSTGAGSTQNIIFFTALTFVDNNNGSIGIFPNNPTNLQIKLADNSAFAPLVASVFQVNGTDSGISRLGAGSLAIGNGTAGDTTGTMTLKEIVLSDFGSAPTSAETAGTVGEIVRHGGLLYFCSVTGAAGSATWNSLNMTAV